MGTATDAIHLLERHEVADQLEVLRIGETRDRLRLGAYLLVSLDPALELHFIAARRRVRSVRLDGLRGSLP